MLSPFTYTGNKCQDRCVEKREWIACCPSFMILAEVLTLAWASVPGSKAHCRCEVTKDCCDRKVCISCAAKRGRKPIREIVVANILVTRLSLQGISSHKCCSKSLKCTDSLESSSSQDLRNVLGYARLFGHAEHPHLSRPLPRSE